MSPSPASQPTFDAFLSTLQGPTKPKPELAANLDIYNRVMHSLRLLADADHRVTLLLPLQLDMFSMISIQEAEAIWSVSAAGVGGSLNSFVVPSPCVT